MLEQPEFEALNWTSLQPNGFTYLVVGAGKAWLENYRKTGEKAPFKLIIDGDAPIALVDPIEVGIIAAHLLAQELTKPHTGKIYCIVGGADVTGKGIVETLEKYAGTTVDDVTFRDQSWLEGLKAGGTPENVWASLLNAPKSGFDGGCSFEGSPTDPAVLALYAPKRDASEELEEALKKV